jgi:hypothetical protein
MFPQRDIAQFGVKARPLLPLSPNTRLLLMPEDPRTEEKIERDIQRQAEQRTRQMFPTTQSDSRTLVPRGIVALVVLEQFSRAVVTLASETHVVD